MKTRVSTLWRLGRLVSLASLLLLVLTVPLRAEDVVEPKDFKHIAGQLRCPTCTGLSVLDSDAAFSVQIKDQVREQLSAGKSEPEIIAYFTERYGPWILREPPTKGFNALAWILPITMLCLGPLLIWFFAWRRRLVVKTYGVRSTESILTEMGQALDYLRQAKGGKRS